MPVDLSRPVTIFYSYARKDEVLREDLEKHLSLLRRQQIISDWHSRLINPGQEWESEIDKHLESADIILLLVSPDFMASDYCYGKEMVRILRRLETGEARVIPIILRSTPWQKAPFGKLQCLPRDSRPITEWRNRDEAFENVVRGLRKVIEDLKYNSSDHISSTLSKNQVSGTSSPIFEQSFVLSPSLPLWNIPYARNPFFTGRKDVLGRLHDHFAKSIGAQIQSIIGADGLGKTQIALEYAYRASDTYRFIFWMRASSPEMLSNDLVAIANLLSLPEKDAQDQNSISSAVKRWLEVNTAWLLIFDDVSDMAVISSFLSVGEGHILITTRTSPVGGNFNKVEIGAIGIQEGLLLLLYRAGILSPGSSLDLISKMERRDAEEIVRMTKGLPLALDQAGAYIEETRCSLAEYLKLYQARSRGFFSQPASRSESIRAPWAISFRFVQKADPAAAELLRLCAFLPSDDVPEEMISDGAEELGEILGPVAADAFKLNEAIEMLRRYSLVRRNTETKTLSMHRLVQAALIESLDKDAQQHLAERTVCAINRVFPELEASNPALYRRFLPHALACARLIDRYELTITAAIQLLNRVGAHLQKQGRYKEAEPLLRRVVNICEKTLGAQHLTTARSLANLASLYYAQSRYEQAEELYRLALAIYIQKSERNNPEIAAILDNLATISLNRGRYEQAEELYRFALAIYIQIKGEDNLETAAILNNLASIYLHQGRYKEAESILEHSLTIYKKMRKLQHPETAFVYNLLGMLYRDQGRYAEAEPLLQQALAICQKTLGPEHLETARSLSELGRLYYSEEQYAKAEPLLQRALTIQEKTLGPEHQNIADNLISLAILSYRQGEYAKAEPLYQQYLNIVEQIRGPKHLETAAILNTLAILYRIRGRYAEAEPLFQRALEIRDQELGPQHPETAQSLNHLAILYYIQGQYAKAEPLYQRALGIYENILRPEYVGKANNDWYKGSFDLEVRYFETATGLNDLGLLLQEAGDVRQAHIFFDLLLKILEWLPELTQGQPFQEGAFEKVQKWLRNIIDDMDIAQTSRSRLARATALSRAIGSLSESPRQIDDFSNIGRLLVKRITERWYEIVTREAGREGRREILEEVYSPYVFTAPISSEALVGRDDLFRRITSLWARPGQRNSLLIYGHRRMGKTSLAQAITKRCKLGADTELIYLSMESVNLAHVGYLYYEIAYRLWLLREEVMEEPGEHQFMDADIRTSFNRFLARFNKIVGDTRFVLVLDEFELLHKYLGAERASQTIEYLRAQTQTYHWLALAIVGLSDLEDLRRNYSNPVLGWEAIRVSFLDLDLVGNLLANPPNSPDFPLDYTPKALELIKKLSHGQPYLVQVLGDLLVQHYNHKVFNEHQEHSGIFDASDVEMVVGDSRFYSTAAAYFEGVWDQVSKGQPKEKKILLALAQQKDGLDGVSLCAEAGLEATAFEEAVRGLKRHDVLTQEGKRLRYQVPLMQRWVRDTRLNSENDLVAD